MTSVYRVRVALNKFGLSSMDKYALGRACAVKRKSQHGGNISTVGERKVKIKTLFVSLYLLFTPMLL